MKVWVADELGKIKSCVLEDKLGDGNPLSSELTPLHSSDQHDRGDYVQILAHAKWPKSDKPAVAIARKGGLMQILDAATGDMLWNRVDTRIESEDPFVGLEERDGRLFWCTNRGFIGFTALSIYDSPDSENPIASTEPIALEISPDLRIEKKDDGGISKARCHPRFPNIFAFGGKDVNLEIWGAEPDPFGNESYSLTKIWGAKNVGNDEYNLQQPVWISDLQFLDQQQWSADRGYLLAVCTRFRQVRLYSTKQSQKPVLNVEIGSSPFVSLVLGANAGEVILADSHGKVISFSLAKGVANGDFTGPTGSILSLDVHRPFGANGILACVGLDRILWILDLKTRSMLGKVDCKTKMTSVLIIDGSLEPSNSGTVAKRKRQSTSVSPAASDDEDGRLWATIPEISDEGGGKRRRSGPKV